MVPAPAAPAPLPRVRAHFHNDPTSRPLSILSTGRPSCGVVVEKSAVRARRLLTRQATPRPVYRSLHRRTASPSVPVLSGCRVARYRRPRAPRGPPFAPRRNFAAQEGHRRARGDETGVLGRPHGGRDDEGIDDRPNVISCDFVTCGLGHQQLPAQCCALAATTAADYHLGLRHENSTGLAHVQSMLLTLIAKDLRCNLHNRRGL